MPPLYLVCLIEESPLWDRLFLCLPLTVAQYISPNKYRLSHSLIRAKQQFRRINLEGRNAIMADLRFNCTEKYKKQIKKQAVDKGVSVSQLLSEVVLAAIPADDEFIDYDELRKELDEVRTKLIYESSTMTQEERNCLKHRKDEIKNLLKKEVNGNGR
jgi:hypothetical protein